MQINIILLQIFLICHLLYEIVEFGTILKIEVFLKWSYLVEGLI